MTKENLLQLVKPLIKPITKLKLKEEKLENLPLLGSHFGGNPYFESGGKWPICPDCNRELDFICQIDYTQGFHEKHKEIALFTFFYCWECLPCGGLLKDETEGQWVVKIYPNPSEEKAVTIKRAKVQEKVTKPCIGEIYEAESLPDWDEIDLMKLVEKRLPRPWAGLDIPGGLYQSLVEKLIGEPEGLCTFLGGYPKWIQGGLTPKCSKCGSRMSLLAQINSEENAGIEWRDDGAVYLFFCPNHPHEIKFVIQCY